MDASLSDASFKFSCVFEHVLHLWSTVLQFFLEIAVFQAVSKLWLDLCLCHGPHYDSGKADFLIALSDSSRLVRTLEGAFALFGQVLEGLGFIQSLSRTPCSEEGVPQIYHKILSIRVETFGDEYDFTTCEEPPPLPRRPICESESDPLEQTQA